MAFVGVGLVRVALRPSFEAFEVAHTVAEVAFVAGA